MSSAAEASTLLGAPGESCRAASDCMEGLGCLDSVCRDLRENLPCSSSVECGPYLSCVDRMCVNAYARSKGPPEKPPFKLGGVRGYLGFGIHGGYVLPYIFDLDDVVDVEPTFITAFNGGVFIDHTHVGLEFSPKTYLPAADSLDTAVQLMAVAGHYIHIVGPLYYPIRGGVGFAGGEVTRERVWFQAKLDAVNIALRASRVMIDVAFPSYRLQTDFEDVLVQSWHYGAGMSFLF